MSQFGFIYELYNEQGKRILTQSVSGTRMGMMLEHVAKTVNDHKRQLGENITLKMLQARLNENTVIETPEKLESLNTLITMAVEHYNLQTGQLVIETKFDAAANETLLENLKKVLASPTKVKKLVKALNEDDKDKKETLELPSLETGDTLLVGKFKNRKAEITGFDKDENNQPVAKTTKGDQKIFKPRVAKLMSDSSDTK